jgi:hypothetical protein
MRKSILQYMYFDASSWVGPLGWLAAPPRKGEKGGRGQAGVQHLSFPSVVFGVLPLRDAEIGSASSRRCEGSLAALRLTRLLVELPRTV